MHNYYFPMSPSSSPWYPAWTPDGKRITVSMAGSLWNVEPATGIADELVYTKMDAPCAHDRFLAAFCEAVKAEAEAKLRAGGVDPDAVRARLAC